MSLTRNQWIEMWDSLKIMEDALIQFPYARFSGPFNLKRQNDSVKEILTEIRKMKRQVESVIGQME